MPSEAEERCGLMPRRSDYGKSKDYKAALRAWKTCVRASYGTPTLGSELLSAGTQLGAAYLGGQASGGMPGGVASGMPSVPDPDDSPDAFNSYNATGSVGQSQGWFEYVRSVLASWWS